MPLSEECHRAIDRVVDLLDRDHRFLFLTGAGISADSGLPTYRGVGGLYADENATPHGLPIEDLLSGPMMRSRPELTWRYLREIEDACRGATFNRAHQVIAEMESHFAAVWTLTQNVDGFHRQAGATNVIDIHGDLHHLVCPRRGCGWREVVADYGHLAELPRCPNCGAVIRPDVVLFGEPLSEDKLRLLEQQRAKGFDVVFSVGTSSLFPYIIAPVKEARKRGIPTVEINPGRTEVSELVDIKIQAGAAEALDSLWSRYRCRLDSKPLTPRGGIALDR
jgi:NAD-dependent deacetylase